jgi:hypothetical protein
MLFLLLILYTVHIANAQSNITSAGGANNMTKGSNITGATGNTTGSSIHTINPVRCDPTNFYGC